MKVADLRCEFLISSHRCSSSCALFRYFSGSYAELQAKAAAWGHILETVEFLA